MRDRTIALIGGVIGGLIVLFFFITSPIGLIFLFGASNAIRQPVPAEEEILTSLLIEKAEQLKEVTAYLAIYNEPRVDSERMKDLDLTYSMLRCEARGEPCVKVGEIYPHATLRVWFNNDLTVKGFTLWCVDGRNTWLSKIESNIVEYLEEGKCV